MLVEVTAHITNAIPFALTRDLEPGRSWFVEYPPYAGGAADAWCTFEVSGGARHLRATACVVSAVDGNYACKAVVPAR